MMTRQEPESADGHVERGAVKEMMEPCEEPHLRTLLASLPRWSPLWGPT